MIDEFIKNLTNPPECLEKGQVWYSNVINEELLITDTSIMKAGVIRIVVVSPLVEITDGNDITVDSSKHSFLPSDRVALRLTTGPTSVNDLNYFRGHINKDVFTEIIESQKNRSDSEYTEIQKIGLVELLNKLELLRSRAVQKFEIG